MAERHHSIRDKIKNNDVTTMRSYLEVDVAEWFSDNQVPFAYEGFTIPSVVGPGKDRWDKTIEAIQGVGKGERESITLPDGTEMDAFDILDLWNQIYEKHRLMDETVSVPPRDALAGFDKQLLLPDYALYPDAGIKDAGEDFDWGSYDYLVEVSGLYGVGLPDESDETEWWDWYRVSAVAFKELMYRLLGLWDKVYWVIPNQPYIPGVTDGIPNQLRDDDHYIIMNTTSAKVDLDPLADALGLTESAVDSGLSASVQPAHYDRPSTAEMRSGNTDLEKIKWSFDGVNVGNVDAHEKAMAISDEMVVFHGEMGEVYVHNTHAHVRESQWRRQNYILIQEYVLDSLRELSEAGIIEGLSK